MFGALDEVRDIEKKRVCLFHKFWVFSLFGISLSGVRGVIVVKEGIGHESSEDWRWVFEGWSRSEGMSVVWCFGAGAWSLHGIYWMRGLSGG